MGGRLEGEVRRLVCRRRRLRKWHQDDGHRDTADLTWCPAPSRRVTAELPRSGDASWMPSTAPVRNKFGLPISPTTPASNEPYDQQKYNRADRGIDDLPHDPGSDGNAELWKQQTGDQRAGDTDENIADDPKARAAHD